MPGYKTHTIGGIIIAFAILLYARTLGYILPYQMPELCAAALCGALFPDVDTGSMGRKLTLFVGLGIGAVLAVFRCYQYALCVLLALFLLTQLPHRGPTHRVFFLLFSSATVLLCVAYSAPALLHRSSWCVAFFLVGALSHLILDGRFLRLRFGRKKRRMK